MLCRIFQCFVRSRQELRRLFDPWHLHLGLFDKTSWNVKDEPRRTNLLRVADVDASDLDIGAKKPLLSVWQPLQHFDYYVLFIWVGVNINHEGLAHVKESWRALLVDIASSVIDILELHLHTRIAFRLVHAAHDDLVSIDRHNCVQTDFLSLFNGLEPPQLVGMMISLGATRRKILRLAVVV